MEKVLQELFWVHFFGRPYRSKGTKTSLDAELGKVSKRLKNSLPSSPRKPNFVIAKIAQEVEGEIKITTT